MRQITLREKWYIGTQAEKTAGGFVDGDRFIEEDQDYKSWLRFEEAWTQLSSGDGSGFLLADGTRVGSSSQAQDFGANGVKADAIGESTTDAGIDLGAGLLFVDTADSRVGVNTTDPQSDLHVNGQIVYIESSSTPILRLYNPTTNPTTKNLGRIQWRGQDSATNEITYAWFAAYVDDYTDGDEKSRFDIRTVDAGVLTSQFVIENTGAIKLDDGTIKPELDGDTAIQIADSSGAGLFLFNTDLGNLGVGITPTSDSYPLDILRTHDDMTGMRIENASTGTSARVQFLAQADTAQAIFGAFGSNYSALSHLANMAAFYDITGDGMVIGAFGASSTIDMYTGGLASGNLRVQIDASGHTGFNATTPTAWVDIGASTTSEASLRLRAGTAPSSPNDGDIWYDGTRIMFRDATQLHVVAPTLLIKPYFVTTQGLGFGADVYTAGFYESSATDSNLTQASTTQTLGGANTSYAAHAFIVAGGAGSTDGSDLVLTVSGTSITDAGVRTPGDSEVICADCTAASTDEYFETPKKWLGQITYTLTSTGGTAFSFDFNYGLCKYDDIGNRDHRILDIEAVGFAGANESNLDIQLIKHTTTGWTYAATGFDPIDATRVLTSLVDEHSTDDQLNSGEHFAFKRTGLAEEIDGSGEEGYLIFVSTTANNAIEYCNIFVGVELI